METNFFGLCVCVCVLQVTLVYESIVLCMCSGKYNDIYFYMKITFWLKQNSICSDRILTFGIKSIRLPAKVGLVVTDLITSPVVSWRGWETPPPQHRGSAVILCSTTAE